MTSDGDLRPLFRDRLRAGFHWQSIETGLLNAGVPDACFGHESQREGWVEFKQTREYAVTLRPEQVGWLVQRSRHGGRCFVAVRRWGQGTDGFFEDELWLWDGLYARELKTHGLRWLKKDEESASVALLGRWTGGPGNWDWGTIEHTLAHWERPT